MNISRCYQLFAFDIKPYINEIRYVALKCFILTLLLIPISAYANEQEVIVVKPTKVTPHEFYEKFTAVGQCKFENSKTYYAKTLGTIDSISIIQGKNVNKGDTLVTIDADIAEATKSKAEAAFESAKTTYDRDMSLLQKKIISKDVSDKSKVALETTRAELVSAINKYNDMIIKAPFNGYVGVVRARIGDDIKAGDYLFSLVAIGDKTIFVELPETMHKKVNKNTEIYVTDSLGHKIAGEVLAVSNYLNDNGTITAKFIFPPSTKVIHGSYSEVEIVYNKHKGLAVPEETVLKNSEGNFVYKITQENKVKQIYVTTGSRTNNMIEIISNNIEIDDLIILEGLTKVNDGTVVSIIKSPIQQSNQQKNNT